MTYRTRTHRTYLVLCAVCALVLGGCALPSPGLPVVGVADTAGGESAYSRARQPAAPTAAPTAAPAMPALPSSSVLSIKKQAAALLPKFAPDLAMADEWDSYAITATLIPDNLTIAGDMRVEMRNRGTLPIEALYFHLYPNHEDFGGSLEIGDTVRVDGQPAAVSSQQDDVLLRVDLPRLLAPGERTTVALSFVARSQRNASGSVYGAFNMEAGVWSLASFYPVLAKRFGNEWDLRPVSSRGDLSVTDTALYDVAIDTPPDWMLVATGERVLQQQLDHGPRRERFVSGPQRDFFLAALRGLDQASSVVDGTRIVSYYQPRNSALGQHGLRVAADSLRIFNQQYGRYPLTELEVIQVPLTRFLGVEYPGVILIEQQLYARGGRIFDTTVAHEVGHQWWYNLVGNDAQGEPWLDEGLTSYSQVVYYQGLGNSSSAEGELQRFRSQYLAARNAGRDSGLAGHVDSFAGNYVALVYAKSALFFHALRLQMGDEAFFEFVQNYYQTYRYNEATGPEMLLQAEAACDCSLQQLYDAWVNGAAVVEVP